MVRPPARREPLLDSRARRPAGRATRPVWRRGAAAGPAGRRVSQGQRRSKRSSRLIPAVQGCLGLAKSGAFFCQRPRSRERSYSGIVLHQPVEGWSSGRGRASRVPAAVRCWFGACGGAGRVGVRLDALCRTTRNRRIRLRKRGRRLRWWRRQRLRGRRLGRRFRQRFWRWKRRRVRQRFGRIGQRFRKRLRQRSGILGRGRRFVGQGLIGRRWVLGQGLVRRWLFGARIVRR